MPVKEQLEKKINEIKNEKQNMELCFKEGDEHRYHLENS